MEERQKMNCELKRTLIIAEAGVNHNGDFNLAKRMVEAAKECGADIIKFQTADLDSLVVDNAPISSYQRRNIGTELSQKEMLRHIMLPMEKFKELAEYCKMCGIEFLSTPFDIKSLHYLNAFQNLWKIPSGEITNVPYLIEMAKTHKRVFLSTGMSSLDEVKFSVDLLREYGTKEISLLHCTTQYPAPLEDINLNAMVTLREHFQTDVGYSDHTEGIEVAIAAAAMGATVIEKHFTLDKKMKGPDHKASLEPRELKAMISAIRNVNLSMGTFEKRVTESERENRRVARKSIVALTRINKGEKLTEKNITTKRPGTGISPIEWFHVLGSRAVRDFERDEMIEIKSNIINAEEE